MRKTESSNRGGDVNGERNYIRLAGLVGCEPIERLWFFDAHDPTEVGAAVAEAREAQRFAAKAGAKLRIAIWRACAGAEGLPVIGGR